MKSLKIGILIKAIFCKTVQSTSEKLRKEHFKVIAEYLLKTRIKNAESY